MRISIRTKLILAIGLPLVLIYLGVLWLDYRSGRETALNDMKDHLTELAAHHAERLGAKFSTVAQVARSTATFLETQPDMSEEDLYALLRNTLKANPGVFGSCIAFEPGAFHPDRPRVAPYVCRAADGVKTMDIGKDVYDYMRWDWYLVPRLLDQPVWTDPYFDEGAGNILMCTYSVPFRRKGKLRGITTVDISLENLRHEVSSIKMSKGYCIIVSQSGRFISHPDEALIMRETIFSLAEWYEMPALAELGREMISHKRGVRRIPDYRTREPKWVVFAPIVTSGWSFAAVIPEQEVLAPVYAEMRRKLEIMIVGLVLIVGIILLTAIHITRPMSRLASVVEKVANGDLDVQATDIHSRDEIGQFARAFNQMVTDLKGHVEALTRETKARESVESELRIARQIQASLLPRTFPPFPDRKEFDLHAVNSPAKQVAGDFFDFYFVTDERLLITIADVSGKGVPAALFMAVTRTLLKNLVLSGLGPAEVLNRANDILVEDNDESMFVTLFLAIYETDTGKLRYANAGHNPPFHLTSEGKMHPPIKATGPILGVIPDIEYTEDEVQVDLGDVLVLYTDGVTEAQNTTRELYGEERFLEVLINHVGQAPEDLCDTVIAAVNEYQGENQFDDITLLVFRRNQ
ncbi:MAG: SpoIIE family protein phosphatase [Planctomycetes bacterium]|nr:SpoIIE family protein phosphatase [Planctomycetota bacterium]